MLRIDNVYKSFSTAQGRLLVLKGVAFTLEPGQSVALMGESGSGKSTLLHLIAGLDRVDSGHILVDGLPLPSDNEAALAHWRRQYIGLVFQQFNLLSSMDVGSNLAFQARLADRYDPRWIAHLAERLGLKDFMHRYPEQLSGGQQQRVAIGRALAARPSWVLADEPTGSLDETTGDAVLELLLQLVQDTGAGLLMVTHSARLAGRLSRCLRLVAGRAVAEVK